MAEPALKLCIPEPGRTWSPSQLDAINPCLEKMNAGERIQWALDFLPNEPVMTSSFGAQSAVLLHMVTQIRPDMPVIVIDTGYLFPETYRFIDELSERLNLNIEVVRPEISPTWLEARHGKLWEQGVEGIRRYNQTSKVLPMERALKRFSVGTWFSGLRRSQSESRRELGVLALHGQVVKVQPLIDWSNRDLHRYLKQFALPYHPLWEQGYVSIGDVHTSRPLATGMEEQDTRFFGLVRECGLHEPERFSGTAV